MAHGAGRIVAANTTGAVVGVAAAATLIPELGLRVTLTGAALFACGLGAVAFALSREARAGLIPEFTGVSDPYEEPADADIVIDTAELTAEEAAQQIVLHCEKEGYVVGDL